MHHTILLVSEPAYIQHCAALLSAAVPDWHISPSSSLDDARLQLYARQFDAVIVHSNCAEATALLRHARQSLPRAVCILCSDDYDPALDDAARAAGADAYFDISTIRQIELGQRLHQLLTRTDDDASALRLSAERLPQFKDEVRAIFRQVPDVVVGLVDRDYRVVLVDGGGVRLSGADAAQLEGLRIPDFIPAVPFMPIKNRLDKAFSGRTTTIAHAHAGRLYRGHIQPVMNEADEVVLVLAVLYDITDMQAEAISSPERALDRLLDQASHELMTPLAGARTSLYLMQRAEVDEYQQHQIARLGTQIDRLEGVIRRLLTLSQLENNPHKELHLEPVNLNNIASAVISAHHAQNSTQPRNLSLMLAPRIPLLLADVEYVRMAVEELLANALNYTPHEGHITLSTHPTQNGVALTVSDTGIGIPPEELPRIFEYFYRAENARRLVPERAGLGLCVVQRIVRGHGGTVQISPHASGGTRACLTFPLAT